MCANLYPTFSPISTFPQLVTWAQRLSFSGNSKQVNRLDWGGGCWSWGGLGWQMLTTGWIFDGCFFCFSSRLFGCGWKTFVKKRFASAEGSDFLFWQWLYFHMWHWAVSLLNVALPSFRVNRNLQWSLIKWPSLTREATFKLQLSERRGTSPAYRLNNENQTPTFGVPQTVNDIAYHQLIPGWQWWESSTVIL